MATEQLGNSILAQLPEDDLASALELSELVDSDLREQVYKPEAVITDVYFPISSVFSLTTMADERVVVEVATIGREGMVGLPVFLGATSSPHAAFCQVAGRSVWMTSENLERLLARSSALHRALGRFTQATLVQIAQNVVCNNTHNAQQRAARWLLTTHDRVTSDEFPLTQQFLSQMLGLRRPTVSEVAGALQAQGLVKYRRGVMTIIDRPGLEAVACECYGVVKAEFDDMTRER